MENIIPVRALKDNYIWMLLDAKNKKSFAIDPGEAAPVIETLKRLEMGLAGILVTHHHWDHTGGIEDLLDYAGNIPVIASHRSNLMTVNHRVKDDDNIPCLNFHLKAMEIPGHTLDHTAYYINSSILFSGDTLFSAGCGRIFEGTPEMMFATLNKILTLDENTKLYCGHEYTLANLRFAEAVEPQNPEIKKKMNSINGCSLPSTLKDEKLFNPFLRCHIPDVIQAAEKCANKKLRSPLEVFTAIREWKNNWNQ
jgi:hydroxyacylglutathione hydrolase